MRRVHQLRHSEARQDPNDCSADRDFVGNNEMLEVDEGGRDEERNKKPVSDRDVPRKNFPDPEKEKRGEKFDGEITEGDAGAAVRAFAAKEQPAQERDVLVPGELGLTTRAEPAVPFAGRTR
jgi:hypothetical protein